MMDRVLRMLWHMLLALFVSLNSEAINERIDINLFLLLYISFLIADIWRDNYDKGKKEETKHEK